MTTQTQLPTLPWNLVTDRVQVTDYLNKKLRQKISKLERHLQHFPPDAVHLQVVLERHPKKEHYTAGLTLRVPSNILRSEKAGPDLIKAFDDAVKALLRELNGLKAELRREPLWKRKTRREALREYKSAGFAAEPMAVGTGPQTLNDVVRELVQRHYNRLLQHARRHIRHDELAGEVPKGALDAREVADEVVRQAVARAARKPEDIDWLPWFYRLVHEELRRQRRALKREAVEEVPLEQTQPLPEEAEAAEGYDAEQPLDIVEQELEPPVAEVRELVPDRSTPSPDEEVARKDLLEYLQSAIQTWPRAHREVFELYFVEGFEPDEIAMILNQPAKQVRSVVAELQDRLRQELLAAGQAGRDARQ